MKLKKKQEVAIALQLRFSVCSGPKRLTKIFYQFLNQYMYVFVWTDFQPPIKICLIVFNMDFRCQTNLLLSRFQYQQSSYINFFGTKFTTDGHLRIGLCE